MYSYYDKKRRRKKNQVTLRTADQFKLNLNDRKWKKKYINSVKMLRVVIKSLIMSAAYYQYLPTAPVWF